MKYVIMADIHGERYYSGAGLYDDVRFAYKFVCRADADGLLAHLIATDYHWRVHYGNPRVVEV